MNEHVMIDLETMGTGSFAPILSIGAVKFNPHHLPETEAELIDTTEGFHMGVSLQSCMSRGMLPDAGTVMWWLDNTRQSARERLLALPTEDLANVLEGFSQWFGADKPVWGNGATFDNVILSNAFGRCGLPKPWSYKNDRCYRTFRALAPHIAPRDVGTAHSALDDARAQVWHMQTIICESVGLIVT